MSNALVSPAQLHVEACSAMYRKEIAERGPLMLLDASARHVVLSEVSAGADLLLELWKRKTATTLESES